MLQLRKRKCSVSTATITSHRKQWKRSGEACNWDGFLLSFCNSCSWSLSVIFSPYFLHAIHPSCPSYSFLLWYDTLICLAYYWFIPEVRISSKLPTLLHSAVFKSTNAANYDKNKNHLTWRIFSHYKCKFHFWIKFYFQWSSQIYMVQFMNNYSILIGIICSSVLFPKRNKMG